MYVCHCRAVTDHTIDDELDRGATTIEELAERCGAGAECGGCWPELERLLRFHQPRELVSARR